MIGVDWGTTSFRAYRLAADGKVLEARSAPRGILSMEKQDFSAVLKEQIAGWPDDLVLMCGMVGSRQGWKEVPYVNCPAGPSEIAAQMESVRPGVWIVPGLSCIDASGVPDVMRGEETQLIGVADSLPAEALVCLPGTHSKWARVRSGTIEGFSTFFTGELYAVLRDHSLLGRMMENGPPDAAAFSEGIARSGEDGGLLHHLFGVRTRGLFGELRGQAAPSYLSGLLIGHELRASARDRIHLVGAPELVALYAQGAELLGIEATALDPQAAARVR